MRSLMKQVALAVAAVALTRPVLAHGQAITRADLIGSWRTRWAYNAIWTPTTGVFAMMAESSATLDSDGTYTSDYTFVVDTTGTTNSSMLDKGKWTLVGDTLVVDQHTDPTEPTSRGVLSRRGDTLSIAWLPVKIKVPAVDTMIWSQADGAVFTEHVDPSQLRVKLTPPPATLKPTDLAGTWVSKGAGQADTLTLHEDGTWAAKEELFLTPDRGLVYRVQSATPNGASHTGKWYLGPANMLVMIDAKQRQVSSTEQRWRGPVFKLQGRQLVGIHSWGGKVPYDRVGP